MVVLDSLKTKIFWGNDFIKLWFFDQLRELSWWDVMGF
jgi:hypothetical protein